MEIITIANQKGGVGKSTTVHAMGSGLMLRGHRVLFVDLDSQGNLSYTMQADDDVPSALDILTGNANTANSIQHLKGGDLIAGTPALAGADNLLLSELGKEYRLREALKDVSAYDYILIDTPPALGVLTINALTAASCAIIPAQADIYSLQGIGQLSNTIQTVKQYCNPGLTIDGILLTRFNARAVLSRDIADIVEDTAKQLHTRLYKARIRENIAAKEAQANRQSLLVYAPKSNAASDYNHFLDEFLEDR
ncbi:ParA family protein [Christensenellaceae bacterium OttesenSCG-928-K19]|nr:ParA family protein [Christensenellaceae bacterium OttesenSCG-928-K19]